MRTIRAVDLFAGKGGWSHGLLAAGWDVDGYDIADMGGYPARLHLRDVRAIDGAEFADAGLIVASPPCQEYSYMAMPWSRGKQIAAALRGNGEFPEGYTGSRTVAELTALFDACFRIQRQASAARGGHVPMVVENVKGAEPWVGRARWHFGSFYLWGDVPALMPPARAIKVPGFRFDGSRRSFQTASVEGIKAVNIAYRRDGYGHTRHLTNRAESDRVRMEGKNDDLCRMPSAEPMGTQVLRAGSMQLCGLPGGGARDGEGAPKAAGIKQPGLSWPAWFDDGAAAFGSHSSARKEASARIAMIPFPLARWIGECYYPADAVSVRTAKALCTEALGGATRGAL